LTSPGGGFIFPIMQIEHIAGMGEAGRVVYGNLLVLVGLRPAVGRG